MTHLLNDLIADIITRIEAGVPPWRQAWTKSDADPRPPLRADGEPFSGSNAWLLSFAGAVAGYTSPYWFTFRQALAIGAPVAKGAKGSPAILYKTRIVDGDAAEDPSGTDTNYDGKTLRYLKTYAVFNAQQLSDCPAQYLHVPKFDPQVRALARNAVLDAIPARVEFGDGKPRYVRSRDLIVLPPPEAFDTVDDFLATKAHEQLHWSGAPHRLAREFGRRFGDEAYAFEELVAEIGAAGLGLRIGLAPQLLDSHAAYLAHWSALLKHRPGALLEASGHAQRAVDYLLAFSAPGQVAAPLAA